MQKRWRSFFIGFALIAALLCLSSSVLAQQCLTPTNGQLIGADTILCAGTYTLPAGLRLGGDTVLDCGGATLQGAVGATATSRSTGTGILVIGNDAQLRNCILRNYAIGIDVDVRERFVSSNIVFANNGNDQIAATIVDLPTSGGTTGTGGEGGIDDPAPSTGTTDTPLAPGTTPGTTSTSNTSIWEVADVQSERLLENALQFEYDTETVPAALLAERVSRLQQTLQDVRIEREFVYRNGQTHVRIHLKPARGFFSRVVYENITLYEYIPKCFAELVGDVVFDGGQPQTLVQDPLLKKVLPRDELTFSYSRALAVSERCKELFRIIGVGDGRQVQTLGSVLASEGIGAVFTTFPFETVVVIVLLCSIIGAGFMFKRSIDEVRR